MNMMRSPPQAGMSVSDPNINRTVSVSSISSPATNITMRNNPKRVRLDDTECTIFDMFKDEMNEMMRNWMKQQDEKLDKLVRGISRLENFEKGLSDIKSGIESSNNEIEKALGELSAQIKDLDKKIGILDSERKNTCAKIFELEEKNESIERVMRKTCIEIRGVPKRKREKKEDLLDMVNNLINNIGIDYSQKEIKDIYRLPSKENALTATIVTEFTNTFIKEKVLKGAKIYNTVQPGRQINTKLLGLEGTETILFVSDHLTSKAKRLHFLAKDFARSENYQYCWIANGRIFLRKKEGDKYVVVKNEHTFQQLQESYKSKI